MHPWGVSYSIDMALRCLRGWGYRSPRSLAATAAPGVSRRGLQLSMVTFDEATPSNEVRSQDTVFSGIQPTGVPHLGNYFGAVCDWVKLQEKCHVILSVVDLHSITLPQEPNLLRENIRDMMACLLASGIDPSKTILFQQSSVSQHAEFGWVLGCLTTMPRLEHLPQWKQKSESMKEVPLGLFTYPVLQAADILLYKATHVPVGDDQVKHIELARHLTKVFNKKYGYLFPAPKPVVGGFKRIKSLRNPANKMSKSDDDAKSRIELLDEADVIRNKLKKAVTDFTSQISYDPVNRPGIANLIDIECALEDKFPEEVVDECAFMDTLQYKMKLADLVIARLQPIREEVIRLRSDPAYLDGIIQQGNRRAQNIAGDTFNDVKKRIGLI